MRPYRRKRHGNRGAVLTETLIVVGMLTTFLLVCYFFHELYIRKLAAMRESRNEAWEAAGKGCGGGLSGGITGGVGSLIDLLQGDAPDLASAGLRVGAKTNSKHEDVRSAAALGGRSYGMKSETRVACNEVTVNDSHSMLLDLLEWGFHELIPK